MKTGIHVGAKRKTVKEARQSILAILESSREEETVRTALMAFVAVTQVKNVTIQNCTIGSVKEEK